MLGRYLLICLVFVFFEILELAVVIVLKEVHERGLHETNNDKDLAESEKCVSKQITRVQNSVNVSQNDEMNQDRNTDGVTKSWLNRFKIKKPRFFEKLPLTRKIDFLAFIIYHLAYIVLNIIYWV